MDLSLQRSINFGDTQSKMYENVNYHDIRKDKISLIVDIKEASGDQKGLSNAVEFSVDLFVPLIIDKLSDVFLDNFMTINSNFCSGQNDMGFAIKINEFNIKSYSASSSDNQHLHNALLIPNEHTNLDDIDTGVIHKGKKLNYVCSINPTKLHRISGTITNFNGTPAFAGLSNTTTLLNIVEIAATDGPVAEGTAITVAADGAFTATVAVAMASGATTLYFYITAAGAPTDHATTTTYVLVGSTAVASVANTYFQSSGFPRAILEFLIEAK